MTDTERLPLLELRSATEADWLAELQEFRGRVAWNGGSRPAFRTGAGAFLDPDRHDGSAYHLTFRDGDQGRLVGCVRYVPLEVLSDSRILGLLPAEAPRILTRFGCTTADVLEGARLVVDPEWQRMGLASRLLLAGTALARLLGRQLIWGTAGTRQNQERVFLRLGYERAVQTVIAAPDYDDELCVVVTRPAIVPDRVVTTVARYERELRPQVLTSAINSVPVARTRHVT